MKNYEILKLINEDTRVISDHHFFHLKAFKEFEPIRQTINSDFNEFEKEMIRRHNSVVGKNEVVIFLGDFSINKRNKGGVNKQLKRFLSIITSKDWKQTRKEVILSLRYKFHKEEIELLKSLNDENYLKILKNEIKKKDNKEYKENLKKITNKLNGRKILLKGNHDQFLNKDYYDMGFEFVIDKPITFLNNELKVIKNYLNLAFTSNLIMKINNDNVMFSHFGILKNKDDDGNREGDHRYNKQQRYYTELFEEYDCKYSFQGHVHSYKVSDERSKVACVEQIDFTPMKIKDLIKN